MSVNFTIPFTVTGEYSLNRFNEKYGNYRKKKEIEEATYYAIKLAKLSKVATPVEITIHYNSLLDIDNHGYLTKSIIDVIKVELLDGEDNRNSLTKITQDFWDNKDIGVEIETVISSPMPLKEKRK